MLIYRFRSGRLCVPLGANFLAPARAGGKYFWARSHAFKLPYGI